MTTLTEKFSALEAELAILSETTNGYIDTTETKLQAIFDQLDLILVNNAANARALLAAIGQNSPCMPCPTPPIVIPPIGTTPLPINSAACQRSQAFLQFMNGVFTVLDVASSVGIGFNPALITDAFNQVIATLTGVDEPDPISFPEAVQLVGDLVSYIATNLLVGHTLTGIFAPLQPDLRLALFGAGSADEAKAQYDAIVSASDLSTYEKAVLIDAAYGAAYTYFFDPASEPNLAGFDGGACFGSACFVFESVTTLLGGTTSVAAVEWSSIFDPVNDVNGFTSDHMTWATVDMVGWKVKPDNQVTIRTFDGDTGTGINPNTVYTIPGATTFVAIHRGDTTPFTVQVCPPGVEPS